VLEIVVGVEIVVVGVEIFVVVGMVQNERW
jgi:hypothetical protein